jgi:uncharacterized repeat protein (TIGR03803 family)
MKSFSLGQYALSSGVAVAMLAGCGGSQPPIGAPGAVPQTSSTYRVVYRFNRTQGGGNPEGSLINVGGMLYGTTRFGGGGTCSISYARTGCGTVYRLDPQSGKKKLLYAFRGGSSDGAYPNGDLIAANGMLYGTAEYGGGGCVWGCGTVFSVSTTGKESMLHSFDSKDDGQVPLAGLIDVDGTFYGTTAGGGSGSCTCGTVYTISTSGSEKILYSFGAKPDGEYPWAGLIDVKGTLYGTTWAGGSSDYGTVYSITTAGLEKVLHSFTSSPDGASPTGGLIDVSGTLYGTTPAGGDKTCYEVGQTACGVVYSITTAGKEKVVYTFIPTNNFGGGAYPAAALINVNGVMYGTAPVGGNGTGCNDFGCGVVFSVTTSGTEGVLHVFNGGPDGASPVSTMIDVDGTLYGTTPYGGGSHCNKGGGCGTVFALTP